MTVLEFFAIALAGGVGSVIRFVVDGIVRARTRLAYPLGTMVINVTGSFVLGLLTGLASAAILTTPWLLILGTGLIGGYTTFSTASIETVRLIQDRRLGAAAINGIGMLVIAVLAAVLGLWIGRSA